MSPKQTISASSVPSRAMKHTLYLLSVCIQYVGVSYYEIGKQANSGRSTYLNLNDVFEHGMHLYPVPSGTQDLLHLLQDGNHHDVLGTRRPIVTVQQYRFSCNVGERNVKWVEGKSGHGKIRMK